MSRFFENIIKEINSEDIFFHTTSIANLISILKEDSFRDTTVHYVNGKKMKGTSISPSYKFAVDYSDVMIQLGYESDSYEREEIFDFKDNAVIIELNNLPDNQVVELEKNWILGEYTGEYFIIGKLSNISKYIDRLIVNPIIKNEFINILKDNKLNMYTNRIYVDKNIEIDN